MRATFWPVLWLPAVHAVAAGMGVRSIARVAPARMSVAISDDNVEQRKNPALYSATAAVRTDGPASSPPRMRRPAGKPEVLAPAGGWAQARAAVANGADAIYFGVRESFNARARAENFAIDELPELMSFLHSHGVKGFCAVNVLIFDEELREAESLIRALAASGVDALIVQDPAVLLLARRVAEWLPLHASTQMSITSAEGAEFAAHSFGCSRVVVGRELSVREIARVAERTDAEVEAFVHGALCVSYSGQCLSSESWGGRSANRGQCAQACRLPYGLLVNGSLAELGDVQYLLSPQDLMAIDLVPELIDAGVACFKIEGRLKGPEYVALTTRAYRAAVDTAWATRDARAAQGAAVPGGGSSGAEAVPGRLTASEREALVAPLRQVFARGQDADHDGLTPGFLEGVRHQRLVRGRSPGHRGVLVGEVVDVRRGKGEVVVRLTVGVKRGDGVVFDGGRRGMREEGEEGGAIYSLHDAATGAVLEPADEARTAGAAVVVRFGRGAVDLSRVRPGDAVWRTRDHALEAATRLLIGDQPGRGGSARPAADSASSPADSVSASAAPGRALASDGTRPLGSARASVVASGSAGAPLTLRLTDADGVAAEASSAEELQRAQRAPLSSSALRKAIGTLQDQGLVLDSVEERFAGGGGATAGAGGRREGAGGGGSAGTGSLDELVDLGCGLFLPAGEVKATRRRAVAALVQAREAAAAAASAVRAGAIDPDDALPALLREHGCNEAPSRRRRPRGGSNVADGPERSREWRGAAAPPARLSVLCRSPEQAAAAAASDLVDEVGLDFLEVHGLREAVAAVRQAGKRAVVATPRVLKPDEERLWRFYLSLGADALLVRSAGLLRTLTRLRDGLPIDGAAQPTGTGTQAASAVPELRGDASLNAANALTAALFLSHGVARIVPAHDLSAKQLVALAERMPEEMASRLEVVVHQHLPVFHTEHCVFCRFLSDGQSYKDCGHPCETNTVHLRDRGGQDHLVLADMGCRNTVFSAKAQSAISYLPRLRAAGLRHFRVELVDESAQTTTALLAAYQRALDDPTQARSVWSELKRIPDANGNAQGVTLGSLAPRAEMLREEMKPTAASLQNVP